VIARSMLVRRICSGIVNGGITKESRGCLDVTPISERPPAGPYPGFFLGGPIEHRRRENRGAEGAGGWVRGGGVPLPAEKFLYFKYENGAFWCIFGGVGVKIRLPISPIQKRPRFHALITIG
jgi:hypothetical protein